MERLLQDLGYGMRMLRKSPGFTAVAVVVLALAIGSTGAIFRVVDRVLLHPLPYRDSDRIVVLAQAARSNVTDPRALVSAGQGAVGGVNRDIPLANVRTMREVIANGVLRRRFTLFPLSLFAGLAMLLAAIGLYGVKSYSVSERTQELGIRMAPGAGKTDGLRLIVGQGMRSAAIGLLLGLTAALAITRLMSALLFGVSARDPWVFGLVAVLLGALALVANAVPRQRATKAEPSAALRYE